jgi:two-component system, NtrC family, response regulator AtoC
VQIALPPLRAHKDDVPLLIDHFLQQQAHLQTGHGPLRLSAETRRLFMDYDWPGNVRELENLIKRVLVLGSELSVQRELRDAIETTHVAPSPPVGARRLVELDDEPPSAPQTSLKDISRTAAREAERAAILSILGRTRWNRKEAATILGISYKALLYKIKDNHLDDAV